MSCAETIPKLELMADDELTSEQATQVISHIDECSSCRDNWYGILALRQAIKDRAASFQPSAGFEDKLIDSIRKESQQSEAAERKKNSHGPSAAGLLKFPTAVRLGIAAAVVGGIAIYCAIQSINNSSSDTTVTASAPVTTGAGDRQSVAQTALSSTPTSMEEALGNFKQYLQKPGPAQSASVSQSSLASLSNQAGFTVKPMQLTGFKLSEAQLVAAAPGKTSLVRLCYTRINGQGRDSILCYQAASGQLVAKGLAEHLIDGKKICCGKVGDTSVVFIPGQKTNANEVLLVGTISKSDLMDLVLSSS